MVELSGTVRHVRRGWFFSRMVMQVEYDLRVLQGEGGIYQMRGKWRNATSDDIAALAARKAAIQARCFSDRCFRVGDRVKGTRSGFHRGCVGEVVFQEPNGGKVWVLRDGSEGPCWFYADELDKIRRTRDG
jgi:hypothetical protein